MYDIIISFLILFVLMSSLLMYRFFAKEYFLWIALSTEIEIIEIIDITKTEP